MTTGKTIALTRHIKHLINISWASLMAQTVKNLPTKQEIWVQGLEDLLKKEMATHSSILAWRIPRMEEPDSLQSTGSQELDTT